MSKKDQNTLAIVIPYYKIDFFEETIKSIAAQSNKNFSLYIGNDASPNDPLPIIKKYLQPENYNYFDYNSNLGGKNLVLQWERILDNIQEEWFQILGDDDVIAENFVDVFYQNLSYIESKKISVIKFTHQWIDENNDLIKNFNYNFSEINPSEFFLKKYYDEIKSSLSENIFKTSLYRKNKFEKIPLAWGSDDLAILSFANKKNILYLKDSIVKVRISSSSISGSDSLDREKQKAYHELKKLLITKYYSLFSYKFISGILEEYLDFCYYKKYELYNPVIFYYLRKFKFKQFLKALKKTYYIRKNAS